MATKHPDPLTVAVLLSVLLCSKCPSGQRVIRRHGMLSFKPETLIVDLNQRQPYTMIVRCTHPTRENIKSFQSLKIGQKVGLTYKCLVENSAVCGDSYVCLKGKRPCAPAPVLSRKNMEVTGSHKNTLVLQISNASCGHANIQFRCYSALTQTTGTHLYSEDMGSFPARVKTLRPKMTVRLITKSTGTNANTMAVGDEFTLTCRAATGLVTDKVASRWVWQHSHDGPWKTFQNDSITERSSVEKECFIVGTTVLATKIQEEQSCVRRFRCYVAQGSKTFEATAAEHEVVIEGCGAVKPAAIAVAVLGTLTFILGAVALSVTVVQRKKRKRKLRNASETDSETESAGSKEKPDESTASPVQIVMKENPAPQWPAPVEEYQQRRWSTNPISLLKESRVG